MSGNKKIGNSLYQKEAAAYYKQLRKIHSKVFTSSTRQQEEKTRERYSQASLPGIQNLYSIINILVALLKNKQTVEGIDYGCGSHYFVDDMVNQYQWNVHGYDIDKYAIKEARGKYTANAYRYHHYNLLKTTLPVIDNSQDFVFCNAVIQHFDDKELIYTLTDIARVLKPGGILLLIYKCKPENWQAFLENSALKINIIDAAAGKIEIEDKSMQKALQQLDLNARRKINQKNITGMRLFHVFSVEEIIQAGLSTGLETVNSNSTPAGQDWHGVITYDSGKGIPTAALFLTKKGDHL